MLDSKVKQIHDSYVPHSRYLFQEFTPLVDDWQFILHHIEQVVQQSSKIQIAHPEVIFYFFKTSTHESFLEEIAHAGRDIIGQVDDILLSETGLLSADYFRSNCFTFEVLVDSELLLSDISHLFRYEQDCRRALSNPIASVWRMRYLMSKADNELETSSFKLFFDFFEEKDSK